MLKLISEEIRDSIFLSEESNNGKKELFIEGIFMQAEQRNRNGRIYPKAIMEREVNKYINDSVIPRTALGELNHPPRPSIDPERASHLITELRLEGNDVIGKAKVLSTPVGMIVRNLLEDGVKLGVSSRGLGSLKEGTQRYRGSKVVQNDYRLVTVDVVSDPSAHDAWVNGVFESAQYIVENGQIRECDTKKAKKILEKSKQNNKKRMSEAARMANAKALMDAIISLTCK